MAARAAKGAVVQGFFCFFFFFLGPCWGGGVLGVGVWWGGGRQDEVRRCSQAGPAMTLSYLLGACSFFIYFWAGSVVQCAAATGGQLATQRGSAGEPGRSTGSALRVFFLFHTPTAGASSAPPKRDSKKTSVLHSATWTAGLWSVSRAVQPREKREGTLASLFCSLGFLFSFRDRRPGPTWNVVGKHGGCKGQKGASNARGGELSAGQRRPPS